MHGAGDVEEGLVDRDPFDVRGDVTQDVDDEVAQALVLPEVATGDDEIRTQLTRPPTRHSHAYPRALAS